MLFIARCIPRTLHTPKQRIQWPQTCLRRHSFDASTSPQWFEDLRTEMLGRELPPMFSFLTKSYAIEMDRHILSAHVPPTWVREAEHLKILPPSYHQAFFHHKVEERHLLPDNTDSLHSPGGEFVRRVWASGSLTVDPDKYYSLDIGWRIGQRMVCFEKIKEVRLARSGGQEKIIVTIGRIHVSTRSKKAKSWDDILQETHDERRWKELGAQKSGLEEERTLIFMKAHTNPDTFARGELPPVRYITSPGLAEFQHTLTPTPTLLFRFSALTSNDHAIHLNPEYTRLVEGHRNLLVHGPLQLTLVLRFVEQHLKSLPGPPRTIHSIEYRNLAPLYVNEEMTLCGRMSNRLEQDVLAWIEAPSGGMAFRAHIRTSPLPGPPAVVPVPVAKTDENLGEEYDWWQRMSGSSEDDDISHSPSTRKSEPAPTPYVRTEPMRMYVSPLTKELVQRLRLRNPIIRRQEKARERVRLMEATERNWPVRKYQTEVDHVPVKGRVRRVGAFRIKKRATFDLFRKVVRVKESKGWGGSGSRNGSRSGSRSGSPSGDAESERLAREGREAMGRREGQKAQGNRGSVRARGFVLRANERVGKK